jgi:hypothetical protein
MNKSPLQKVEAIPEWLRNASPSFPLKSQSIGELESKKNLLPFTFSILLEP